ncbi:MAG: protein kinase domain-containing protein [Isosphaeraceae bacterium]
MTERDRGARITSAGLEQARRINHVCEEFERRWRSGQRPRIESEVEIAQPGDQAALFEELLILELELRRAGAESPDPDEYIARFPDRQARVAAVFAQNTTASAANPAGATEPATPGAGPVPPASPASAPQARTISLVPTDESQDFTKIGSIGDYDLIEEIARGGMGVVYRARHRSLKRVVALKMILSGQMASAQERERFRREAELAANLDHPHIVPIYEVDEDQGHCFFSMKLVDGASLSKQAGRYKTDAAAGAQLVLTLARAVHHAHGQGFLHCDLKPSNVLLDQHGAPYLTDFGLARRTGADSSLSGSGAIFGTPSYMAPEQATGTRASLGPATDVYGLGAILYELLTGRPPFRADTVMETVVQVLERDPTPPRELRRDIPQELESICLKCLEKSPRDRYPSAQALADELDGYLHGEGIAATGIIPRLRRWNRREPELVARLGGLLIVAIMTQYNYLFVTKTPSFRLHYTVQAVLALWASSAILFQYLMRAGQRSQGVLVFWSAADILFLTIELELLDRFESTLLVGYPLLIAASGLWWRVRLVWVTTLLAIAAYGAVYLESSLSWDAGLLRWQTPEYLRYPDIFMAGLLLTGYVVARQVRRILALSRYYENRPAV